MLIPHVVLKLIIAAPTSKVRTNAHVVGDIFWMKTEEDVLVCNKTEISKYRLRRGWSVKANERSLIILITMAHLSMSIKDKYLTLTGSQTQRTTPKQIV